MSDYEVTTIGDLTSAVTTLKEGGETVIDWATYGPQRRWVHQKAQEASVFAKSELAAAEQAAAAVGQKLDRLDPRVLFMKFYGTPDALDPLRLIGKAGTVAAIGIVGYAIFAELLKKRRKR